MLRQTVIALTAGSSLSEHDNPGDATILVLSGRVRLTAGDDNWEGREGDLLLIPSARHSMLAVDDATVLLSAAAEALTLLLTSAECLTGWPQRRT